MEALDILEAMAASVSYDSGITNDESIEKWQKLFGYSANEASKKLEEQREDLTSLVPEALWDAVSGQQSALGHDRETYSHWLRLPRQISPSALCSEPLYSAITGHGPVENSQEQEYLLRLEGPISSTVQVAEIAGLAKVPQTFEGASDTYTCGNTTAFCKVGSLAKQSIVSWINQYHPSFRPMFIMRSLARKTLDTMSISPTLGRDASLPQHRHVAPDAISRPAQGEYPVWYFFYGTLANQQTLHTLLQHLDGEDYDISNYKLRPARVAGARLTTWGNKYKALIDGKDEDEVEGWAFLVTSELHEEALRSYETSAYEVVRCQIRCHAADGEVLRGCTFRLAIS